MSWKFKIMILVSAILTVIILKFITGAGSFKRHTTISGIFAVCRPGGYEVVCFGDADGKDGGIFCMPLSASGGKCK